MTLYMVTILFQGDLTEPIAPHFKKQNQSLKDILSTGQTWVPHTVQAAYYSGNPTGRCAMDLPACDRNQVRPHKLTLTHNCFIDFNSYFLFD